MLALRWYCHDVMLMNCGEGGRWWFDCGVGLTKKGFALG